jgi:Kdo2-lipid IVA lauroyltransferase/acyltransferase
MTLLPKLAQQTGALILLTWCERLPGGRFCLHMDPLDEPSFQDPAATLEQMAAGMNRAVERMVLHRPGQYLWGYARAKQPREER